MDDQLWRMVWRMVSGVSGWVTKGSDDVMMFCWWCCSPGGVRPGPVLMMVLRLSNCGGRSSKAQSTPGNGDLPYFTRCHSSRLYPFIKWTLITSAHVGTWY
jgi:hypothetical protein